MKHFLPLTTILLFTCAPALAQVLVSPGPLGEPPTTVYRQMTPDGRIVYSDKTQQGAKIDHTLTVAPPDKGDLWSVEGGPRPVIPPQIERTPVRQVSSIPASGRRKTIDEATSDVIRAEMLLEDVRKKREAGRAPLPSEAGDSAPSSAYALRQQLLARELAKAEAALTHAATERDALREKR